MNMFSSAASMTAASIARNMNQRWGASPQGGQAAQPSSYGADKAKVNNAAMAGVSAAQRPVLRRPQHSNAAMAGISAGIAGIFSNAGR